MAKIVKKKAKIRAAKILQDVPITSRNYTVTHFQPLEEVLCLLRLKKLKHIQTISKKTLKNQALSKHCLNLWHQKVEKLFDGQKNCR